MQNVLLLSNTSKQSINSSLNYLIDYRACNCDSCNADLTAFKAYMRSDQAAQSIVEILQGTLFCEDPALSLSEEQKSTCKDIMASFMPLALKVLFDDDPSGNKESCNNYFGGICNM